MPPSARSQSARAGREPAAGIILCCLIVDYSIAGMAWHSVVYYHGLAALSRGAVDLDVVLIFIIMIIILLLSTLIIIKRSSN